jgi:hypothetical protein
LLLYVYTIIRQSINSQQITGECGSSRDGLDGACQLGIGLGKGESDKGRMDKRKK